MSGKSLVYICILSLSLISFTKSSIAEEKKTQSLEQYTLQLLKHHIEDEALYEILMQHISDSIDNKEITHLRLDENKNILIIQTSQSAYQCGIKTFWENISQEDLLISLSCKEIFDFNIPLRIQR
ncbi:MAG: hypothetical protein KDD52_04235 [Bdellovibrionales bacterium]|nr:hypothetical protein [Bdellovibrionales bacterium]